MKWRFAIKYLTSRKSHSVINLIATVSLLAVVVPVAAMVVLLSVFNGFESLVRDLYKVVDADIEITTAAGFSSDDDLLRQRVRRVDGVEALSFVVEREALLSNGDNRAAVRLRGVDEEYRRVVPIDAYTASGRAVVQNGDFHYLVLGEVLAYELGLHTTSRSEVDVYSIGGGHVGSILPTFAMGSTKLGVSATMVMDQQYASTFAMTSLEAANRIFGTEGRADMLMVKVAEGVSHEKVAAQLRNELGGDYKVTLREDKNKSFYVIMRHEKWTIFFVSLLVLVVASLSIIGTVVMLVLEKEDERTTLLSMGADNTFIRGVFVREGLLIAGIGGAIGLALGVGLTLVQQYFGLVKMPNGNFMIENYPVELQALDLLAIFAVFVAVAFAVSKVATSTMINRRK